MRVAVVGSGVIGASVAWHLVQRGQEVLLIDQGQPGAGVSRWTFSWVNGSSKAYDRREYYELCNAGIGAHVALAAELGDGSWLHRTGQLRWADPGDELLARAERLVSWGHDAEIWTADRVSRLLEPAIRFPSGDTEVLVCRDEGWIDGPALVDRLVAGTTARGGQTSFGVAVAGIGVSGGRVTEVVLANGARVGVDAVVNAAGPMAHEVAAMVGRRFPMGDDPGLIVRLLCDPVPIQRVVHPPGVELRPDGPDRLVAHSPVVDAMLDPRIDPVAEPTVPAELIANVHQRAVVAVPELAYAAVADARIARRPVPTDGYPSVGALASVAGYYEAVTHSGITLAALLGRLLAEEIIDGKVDDRMTPYQPDRPDLAD